MEGPMNTITLIDVIVLVLAYVGLSVACLLIRWLIALPYRGDPVQESRERIWRGWRDADTTYGVALTFLRNVK
jgi:hypothetical protein